MIRMEFRINSLSIPNSNQSLHVFFLTCAYAIKKPHYKLKTLNYFMIILLYYIFFLINNNWSMYRCHLFMYMYVILADIVFRTSFSNITLANISENIP